MVSSKRNLPNFDAPPLTEVFISVQFDAIPNLQVPQIGLFWSSIRDRFPSTEQHPPLEPAKEKFGPPTPPKIQLSISQAPPLSRTWFLSESGSELIQVQADRFMHNWRKVEDEDSYPRYEHVREEFSKGMRDFCDFLQEESLGEFRPNQCEISYINHIETNHIWSTHSELGKVLALWNPTLDDDFLSEPESVRVATQHLLRGGDGDPIGRLHISAQPAFRGTNSERLLVLTLTARGAPLEPTSSGVLAFVDKGREAIVRGFVSVTTPDMHKYWRRTN